MREVAHRDVRVRVAIVLEAALSDLQPFDGEVVVGLADLRRAPMRSRHCAPQLLDAACR